MGAQLQRGPVGSHKKPKQLSALHLSSYCLVILLKQLQLPTGLTSFPLVTSRNCDTSLTFPIPLRGSAFPWSSLLHPVSWELGESASSERLSGDLFLIKTAFSLLQ